MAKKTVSPRAKSTPKAEATDALGSVTKPRTRRTTKAAGDTDVTITTPEPTDVSGSAEPSDEDIRVRAYHRYLERGGGHGMDFEDWLEAKRDLQKLK